MGGTEGAHDAEVATLVRLYDAAAEVADDVGVAEALHDRDLGEEELVVLQHRAELRMRPHPGKLHEQ